MTTKEKKIHVYKLIQYIRGNTDFSTNLVTNWASIFSLHPFKNAAKMEMVLAFSYRAGIFFIVFW